VYYLYNPDSYYHKDNNRFGEGEQAEWQDQRRFYQHRKNLAMNISAARKDEGWKADLKEEQNKFKKEEEQKRLEKRKQYLKYKK